MKIGFLELSHVFANQVKLPYSTGCVWSHCKTVDEISNHFSFDVSDWFYALDGSLDVTDTAQVKVRFASEFINQSTQVMGDSGQNLSSATFIRLGDT